MPSLAREQLLESLKQRIGEIEASRRPADRVAISLGISALHDLLPERRLPSGALVELLSEADGGGAWSLALFLARQACGAAEKGVWNPEERFQTPFSAAQKVLVIVDGQRCFYPPAAAKLGIDLERLLVVHPKTARDAMLAVDQSLRAPAVGSVIGWYDRLATPAFRRLQLAAETGGGLGLLLRPAAVRRTPSFAALRFLVMPVASDVRQAFEPDSSVRLESLTYAVRRVRLEVLRCRGGTAGQSVILEIDDETGDVRVPAGLAVAATGPRPARASG
jgi:protein ImuA